MIGMMYLVLTALLALNVSKDILNAFVIVNEGIMTTTENFSAKNGIIYNNFQKALLNNEVKVKPYFEKAMKAKKLSEEMIADIVRVRSITIAATEFGKKDEATIKICDTLSLSLVSAKDNYDTPMNVLLGAKDEIQGDGEAYKLKEALDKYRDNMLALLSEKDRKLVKWSIITDDAMHKELGQMKSWGFINFYHTVLAADVAILNKLIADVKNTESDIVAQIYSSIDAGDFKFDQIAAKVIPKSNYIISGDKYEADIFVAAYSTTENPEIVIGSSVDTVNLTIGGTPTPVEAIEGVGKYQAGASGEGERKYGGLIKIKAPDGSVKAYPFKGEYIVARPSATISPTKMNVFYVGVDNPVSISVPGVPSESIIPSITGGGTIRPSGQKGEYIVRVSTQGKCMVNVSAKVGGTNKSMGGMEFRIKNVPNPVAMIGGKSEGTLKKNSLIAAGGVIAKLENFDFDLKFDIVSYDMVLQVGSLVATESGRGARFTDKMSGLMGKTTKGQKVIFEKVRAKGPDGTVRALNTIVFTIE